jgi:inorganic pyrophosphatase
MDITKIPFGSKFPSEVNAVVEIPQNQIGLKYEIEKESGAIFVDRFLTAPMFYPANYGFIPNTLGGDGDPLDILVISPFSVQAGAVIPSKVIGLLLMEDEGGMDEKIIAVPASSVSKEYEKVNEIEDLPTLLVNQIKHFFERYKDLEKNKWVKVQGFKTAQEARDLILSCKK